MRIRLEHDEITRAVRLWINEMYVKGHNATVEITAVNGKNYSDPTSYVIEADVVIPDGLPQTE